MIKINNKNVILAPFLLFNKYSSIAESLACELTEFPMNLFNSEQNMRDSHKAELGRHFKDKVVTLTSCHTYKYFIEIAGSYKNKGYWRHIIFIRLCAL